MNKMRISSLVLLTLVVPAFADESTELKAYLRALKMGSTAEKVRAAQDIGKLGPDAAGPAVPALCDAIADSNNKVGVAALEALEKVDERLHKLISTLLLDKDDRKRSDAMQDISQLENVEATVPVLILLVRQRAGTGDDFRGVPGDVSRAIDTLKSKAPRNSDFIKVLIAASGPINERNKTRNYAITALSELAAEHDKQLTQMPQIKKVLATSLTDRAPETRAAAAEAFGRLGPLHSKEVIGIIKKLKLDSDSRVRDAAGSALDKLQPK